MDNEIYMIYCRVLKKKLIFRCNKLDDVHQLYYSTSYHIEKAKYKIEFDSQLQFDGQLYTHYGPCFLKEK